MGCVITIAALFVAAAGAVPAPSTGLPTNGNPAPNQATIVQLEIALQKLSNTLQLDSSITRAILDTQENIINNISS